MKEIIAASPPYLLALAAMVCFGLAIWFIWHDKLKAATLLSGLFLLCVVLAYFPQLDSVNAFSISFKLRQSLDRADEILVQIRKASIANARAIYMTTAWGGRWGGMSKRDKQTLLDSLNEQLKSVGVGNEELETIERPHIEFIGFDLFSIYSNSVRGVLWHFRTQPNEAEGTKRINEWDGKMRIGGVESIRPYLNNEAELTSFMKDEIAGLDINASDRDKLNALAEKIGSLFNGCLKRGGYTEDALSFLEFYKDKAASGRPEAFYDLLAATPK